MLDFNITFFLRMCPLFQRIMQKVMEIDKFWLWKVMEFEMPKRV